MGTPPALPAQTMRTCSGRIKPSSDTLSSPESLSASFGIHDLRFRTSPLYCASSPRLVRFAVSFRPRKKKYNQSKYHRCSRCGGQVRRRSVRCRSARSRRNASDSPHGPLLTARRLVPTLGVGTHSLAAPRRPRGRSPQRIPDHVLAPTAGSARIQSIGRVPGGTPVTDERLMTFTHRSFCTRI